MINNKEYYKITGDITADFGETITNPVIKIVVSAKGVEASGLLQCEYNVYYSEDNYLNNKHYFKASKNGERLINFPYPVANVPTWGIMTYKEEQRKIIADTFGLDIANVELIQED
tara:strand:+ start:2181 stop:2525 length:345 start_codon:yes stop_codon:yes gene_type:complete